MGKTKKLTQYILPVPKGSKWAASSTSGRGNKGLGDRGRNSHEKDRWTLLEKLLDLQLTSLTQLSWWLLTLPWKIWALQSAKNKTEGFQAYCQQKNQLSEVCRTDLASLIFSQKVPELPIICLVPQLKYKQMTRFMKKDSNLKREILMFIWNLKLQHWKQIFSIACLVETDWLHPFWENVCQRNKFK